jgi:hypothetical protein
MCLLSAVANLETGIIVYMTKNYTRSVIVFCTRIVIITNYVLARYTLQIVIVRLWSVVLSRGATLVI